MPNPYTSSVPSRGQPKFVLRTMNLRRFLATLEIFPFSQSGHLGLENWGIIPRVNKKGLLFVLILGFAAALTSCSKSPRFSQSEGAAPQFASTQDLEQDWNQFADGDSPWARRQWANRVSKLIRSGKGLSSGDDVENLLKKKPAEVIDQLMKDIRFADTVLDFNMYFLGFKANQLKKEDGTYNDNFVSSVYGSPSAITSAKNIIKNGDYLSLLDLYHPVYVSPLGSVNNGQQFESETAQENERTRLMAEHLKIMDEMITEAEKNPTLALGTYCEKFRSRLSQFVIFNNMLGLNISPSVWLMGSYSEKNKSLDLLCTNGEGDAPENFDLVVAAKKLKLRYQAIFAKFDLIRPSNYKPKNIEDLQALNIPELEDLGPRPFFTFSVAQKLSNSSTSFNRKRAAYILKRFFCDEMTGITVEDIPGHTTEVHGSNPSCYACHYKLDPMAGFFKEQGNSFTNYAGRGFLNLDDGVTVLKDDYHKAWKAKPDAGRTWEIGYIRSVSKSALNFYGESLEDLFKFIKKAPEVKQCLVRRLYQYATSPDQIIDGGYLKFLADDFEKESLENSSLAFKKTLKRILLSGAFKTPDRETNQCYDYAPGAEPNGLPCRVSFVVKSSCVACHNSGMAFGGLDLSQWKKLEDGQYSFKHIDSAGKQKPRVETLQAILERLTATDVNKRMPLKSQMSSQDRDTLYLWTNGQIK